MSDEFRFMGKEVVVSENVPNGEMFVVEDKFIMQKEQLEELKKEFEKMSTSATTATLGLDEFQKAINDAASTMSQHNWSTTSGTYTISTDGTTAGSGTWDGNGTAWVTNVKYDESPMQVFNCELCDEELKEPFVARTCELCHAAIMKVRMELFTDREAVYIDDINQLLEET
jgi:hypothetical protein